jgi:hypothetical protein
MHQAAIDEQASTSATQRLLHAIRRLRGETEPEQVPAANGDNTP